MTSEIIPYWVFKNIQQRKTHNQHYQNTLRSQAVPHGVEHSFAHWPHKLSGALHRTQLCQLMKIVGSAVRWQHHKQGRRVRAGNPVRCIATARSCGNMRRFLSLSDP